ncbi:MAG TPA: NusG domain II-containing protein [Clostridiaceae bacterium]|nr:NusG domain II-containing protein [Clostridiaceae bacterium]
MRLKLRYGDYIVFFVIVLVAVLFGVSFFENHTDEKIAVISQNNIVIDRIELNKISEPYLIDYSGNYPGTIEVNNGRIRFLHADCPDQVCVNTGWIDKPGQIAVCLPAGIIIKIEGSQTDVDIIVH